MTETNAFSQASALPFPFLLPAAFLSPCRFEPMLILILGTSFDCRELESLSSSLYSGGGEERSSEDAREGEGEGEGDDASSSISSSSSSPSARAHTRRSKINIESALLEIGMDAAKGNHRRICSASSALCSSA